MHPVFGGTRSTPVTRRDRVYGFFREAGESSHDFLTRPGLSDNSPNCGGSWGKEFKVSRVGRDGFALLIRVFGRDLVPLNLFCWVGTERRMLACYVLGDESGHHEYCQSQSHPCGIDEDIGKG